MKWTEAVKRSKSGLAVRATLTGKVIVIDGVDGEAPWTLAGGTKRRATDEERTGEDWVPLGEKRDPLERVREGSATGLVMDLGRAIDDAERKCPQIMISRKRLWVLEVLVTIACVHARNVSGMAEPVKVVGAVALDNAFSWLMELQSHLVAAEREGVNDDGATGG